MAKDWINASLFYLKWFMAGFFGSVVMTLAAIVCAVSINFKIPSLAVTMGFLLFGIMVPGEFVFIYFGTSPPNWYSNAV